MTTVIAQVVNCSKVMGRNARRGKPWGVLGKRCRCGADCL